MAGQIYTVFFMWLTDPYLLIAAKFWSSFIVIIGLCAFNAHWDTLEFVLLSHNWQFYDQQSTCLTCSCIQFFCRTLSRLRKCIYCHILLHRTHTEYNTFMKRSVMGVYVTQKRAWRWPRGHWCPDWRYGGPQWFGEHCNCLCPVIWTDILFESKLPTRAQMHLWSRTEDSSKTGWAEIVTKAQFLKKTTSFCNEQTSRRLIEAWYLSTSLQYSLLCVFNFEISKLEVIKMLKRMI